MPIHGPPGDRHGTGGGGGAGFGGGTTGPFSGFLDLLLPAISSASQQLAFHAETLGQTKLGRTISDYYSPVLGPGAPERFQQTGRNLGTIAGRAFDNFIPEDFSLIGTANELLLRDAAKPAQNFFAHLGSVSQNVAGYPNSLLQQLFTPQRQFEKKRRVQGAPPVFDRLQQQVDQGRLERQPIPQQPANNFQVFKQ